MANDKLMACKNEPTLIIADGNDERTETSTWLGGRTERCVLQGCASYHTKRVIATGRQRHLIGIKKVCTNKQAIHASVITSNTVRESLALKRSKEVWSLKP